MRRRTILLVDPDGSLRSLWRTGLESMGFEVSETADASSALRLALVNEISLLITELYLPCAAEPCLVSAVRRQAALHRLKILVVSEYTTERDRTWALSSGADAYLLKPVRVGRLLQVAARLAMTRGGSRADARAGR